MAQTIRLDGGPPIPIEHLERIPPTVEWIRTALATLPDPRWQHTDANGHEHRWALTGRDAHQRDEALPTLAWHTEHRPCDGSCGDDPTTCEGYHVTVHTCRECGDVVQPGTITDIQARDVGTPLELDAGELEVTIVDPGHDLPLWRRDGTPVVVDDNGELFHGRVYGAESWGSSREPTRHRLRVPLTPDPAAR